jgi:predicted nucleotidyltransferase
MSHGSIGVWWTPLEVRVQSGMPLRDLNSIEKALTSYFESRPEVEAAYIFGSVVTGRARPDSDIDVAILVEDRTRPKKGFRYRLDRLTDLMGVLQRDDVDVVLLNEAPPLLAHRVLSRGRLVFERSPAARVHFQVRAVNRYLDTQPMRAIYLSYLKKHAREDRIFGR